MKCESKAKDFFSSVFTVEDNGDIPAVDPLCEGKLDDIDVKVECSLKEDKATGDDIMSPRVLKTISDEIALPVAIIFRKLLDTGEVPRDWRTANVTPLFKKGSKQQVDNYRPVSLTSQICKVVESVIRDEMVNHLDKHNFSEGTIYRIVSNITI